MREISERISKLMQEKDLSYAALASMTGIPKSALQRYVVGETPKIPLDRIEAIADALNTTPGYILGWTDTETTNNPPTQDGVRAMLEAFFVQYGILNEGEQLTGDMLAAIAPVIRATIQAMRQSK